MSLDWNSLRPLNGSVQTAFEELCAQLAACEQSCPIDGAEVLPSGSAFVRKGAPDAGVECYWKLPDGSEIAWQAKYFRNPPDSGQWGQIDESVRKALEKHPQLTTYIICLPIDRPDPRVQKQQWFMDRWNEQTVKWQEWASESDMTVTFKYWGQSEIFARLARNEHRGRMFFWFNREFLSAEWFRASVEETVQQVGPRYTPELNVDLPIGQVLEALGRTDSFRDSVLALLREVRESVGHLNIRRAPAEFGERLRNIKKNVEQIRARIKRALDTPISDLAWGWVVEEVRALQQVIEEITRSIREKEEQIRLRAAEKRSQTEDTGQGPTPVPDWTTDDLRSLSNNLNRVYRRLESLAGFAGGAEAKLMNLPHLLLVGNAGTGKTHLLCDVASQRVGAGSPTALLLAQRFDNQEPWGQVIRQLGLSCSNKEELLGALEAAGEACGARALILIDALNESDGWAVWRSNLASMFYAVRQYKRVGIAVSVRTSYEDVVLPPEMPDTACVRVVHEGFAGYEYQAARAFFKYYGLTLPAVPLLIPEFQNPLFLSLICKGLQNEGLTTMPTGLHGVTRLFDFFISAANTKLSHPDILDFNPKTDCVQKAIRGFVDACASANRVWLPRSETSAIVDAVLRRQGYERSLLRHLLSEGLLREDLVYHEGAWVDGILFGYERFGDHLIISRLLEEHLDAAHPEVSFSEGTPLASLIRDETACACNQGIVEALSIQVPELTGRELADVRPDIADYEPVRSAFVASLIWRRRDAFTQTMVDYVNEHVLRFRDTADEFWEMCLTVSCLPDHPFNADRLHEHLMRQNLSDRDSWWSVFLYQRYHSSLLGEWKTAIDRLLDWAWSAEDKSHIGDEPRRLCGIALAWMFTTSHRFLRDRATKAVVNLFTDHLALLKAILEAFQAVNDPYVSERLHAAAYGCALRSVDPDGLRCLAQHVYDTVFGKGPPVLHVLLRDYARGVVELAVVRGLDIEVDMARVRPPYGSPWPKQIPSADELKAEYDSYHKNMTEEELNEWRLYHEIMVDSDFVIYVLDEFHKWSSRTLGGPPRPPLGDDIQSFLGSLTDKQTGAYDRLCEASGAAAVATIAGSALGEMDDGEVLDEAARKKALSAVDKRARAFRLTLGKRKRQQYAELTRRCGDVELSEPPWPTEDRFDRSLAQAWVFQRVLELGWTEEKFGHFDYHSRTHGPYYGRTGKKPERIGKKYQWIAFHEFLALVADNFQMRGDFDSDEATEYRGPWQLSVRDIDPSWIPAKTQREQWRSQGRAWWFPHTHGPWRNEADDVAWLQSTSDLPNFADLIEVEREDGSRWVVLESFQELEEPVPLDEASYETERREVYWMIRTYLVNRADADEVFDWAKGQNFFGRWMPESPDDYHVFLGEFFWSPAFADRNAPYFGHEGWTDRGRRRIPKKVLVTANHYVAESNVYDCSIDSHIDVALPAKEIADGMELTQPRADGRWYDISGNLIAFDPSVSEPGPGALLVRKNAFVEFLDRNDLAVFWTVLGEKHVLGGGIGSRDQYKGCMIINGAFRLGGRNVEGEPSVFFCPPAANPEGPLA